MWPMRREVRCVLKGPTALMDTPEEHVAINRFEDVQGFWVEGHLASVNVPMSDV